MVDKFGLSRDPAINQIYPLIERGIAYHHAGILPTLKEIIEQLFTSGLIKFIFTTETFALGVNMPAKTVVFDALSKFYGRFHHYLKTRDFYQMAGRAGRRGIDKEGFVYSRINPHYIDISNLKKIIYGRYEGIESQLKSCYATIINLYKLMGEKILDIYPRSFHFYQSNPIKKREALSLLKRKIALLKSANYILPSAAISPKGELACRIYSFELQAGELYARKILNSLDEADLAVVICSLVYEPRRGQSRPKLSKKNKRLKRNLAYLSKDIHHLEKRFAIYPLSKKFYFHLSEAMKAWFEGTDFYKLNKYAPCDEGEIVRYFRMSIQLMREILSSQTVNKKVKSKVYNCLRRINRGIIDAEKQLRQEI